MPCPIFGNTYRKTKQSRNGWMIVRSTNSHRCLRSTTRSRSSSAPSAVQLAAATERVGPPPIRRAGASVVTDVAIRHLGRRVLSLGGGGIARFDRGGAHRHAHDPESAGVCWRGVRPGVSRGVVPEIPPPPA